MDIDIKKELKDDWLLAQDKHIHDVDKENNFNILNNIGLASNNEQVKQEVMDQFHEIHDLITIENEFCAKTEPRLASILSEIETSSTYENQQIIENDFSERKLIPVIRLENTIFNDRNLPQLITIENEFCAKTEPRLASILSEIESSSTHENQQMIDNDVSKRNLIPVIRLENTIFNDRNFVCFVCFKIFATPRSLRIHKKVHKNSKNDQKTTNLNISRVKTNKTRYECDQCSFKCRFLCKLKLHKTTHLTEKPFKCNKCDFESAYSNALKKHKLLHNPKKPFSCDYCEYKTANAAHFKIHQIMAHTDEKPIKCDFCDFKCVRRFQLTRHEITHRPDRPFECDQCSFASKDSSNLKSHKKIHSKTKSFQCDKCDFKSAYSTSLKFHKMAHSGHKPNKCELCDFKCARPSLLNKHKKEHTQ